MFMLGGSPRDRCREAAPHKFESPALNVRNVNRTYSRSPFKGKPCLVPGPSSLISGHAYTATPMGTMEAKDLVPPGHMTWLPLSGPHPLRLGTRSTFPVQREVGKKLAEPLYRLATQGSPFSVTRGVAITPTPSAPLIQQQADLETFRVETPKPSLAPRPILQRRTTGLTTTNSQVRPSHKLSIPLPHAPLSPPLQGHSTSQKQPLSARLATCQPLSIVSRATDQMQVVCPSSGPSDLQPLSARLTDEVQAG